MLLFTFCLKYYHLSLVFVIIKVLYYYFTFRMFLYLLRLYFFSNIRCFWAVYRLIEGLPLAQKLRLYNYYWGFRWRHT